MTESTEMFLANLDSMARHIEELRQISTEQLDAILQEHAWAEDHITTSKDDVQEVTEFMLSYTKNQVIGSYETGPRMNRAMGDPFEYGEEMDGSRLNRGGKDEFSLTSRNESRIHNYESWSAQLKK